MEAKAGGDRGDAAYRCGLCGGGCGTAVTGFYKG